ncbi:MAG TPA: TetR/AcrR family transcriptional regulator [Solirubrobacteraceae bacterium]|nr:TetR/AcrR family transcriptional regulator [Solirubrobacteraceae bacterium]
MPRRLTRKERQAHTRSCLMKSASKVFARHGLQQASIEEVAEDAGYTKGAFYANFKSKEELFLAMLDERFAERLEEIDRVIESDAAPETQARAAGADFIRHISADPEWQRLFFEFAAYAARNEDFREELITRYRSIRDRLTELYRKRTERLGVTSPVPLEKVSLMTFAMANGFALEKLLEPDAVADDVYPLMLEIFFAGLRALEQESQDVAPAGASA